MDHIHHNMAAVITEESLRNRIQEIDSFVSDNIDNMHMHDWNYWEGRRVDLARQLKALRRENMINTSLMNRGEQRTGISPSPPVSVEGGNTTHQTTANNQINRAPSNTTTNTANNTNTTPTAQTAVISSNTNDNSLGEGQNNGTGGQTVINTDMKTQAIELTAEGQADGTGDSKTEEIESSLSQNTSNLNNNNNSSSNTTNNERNQNKSEIDDAETPKQTDLNKNNSGNTTRRSRNKNKIRRNRSYTPTFGMRRSKKLDTPDNINNNPDYNYSRRSKNEDFDTYLLRNTLFDDELLMEPNSIYPRIDPYKQQQRRRFEARTRGLGLNKRGTYDSRLDEDYYDMRRRRMQFEMYQNRRLHGMREPDSGLLYQPHSTNTFNGSGSNMHRQTRPGTQRNLTRQDTLSTIPDDPCFAGLTEIEKSKVRVNIATARVNKNIDAAMKFPYTFSAEGDKIANAALDFRKRILVWHAYGKDMCGWDERRAVNILKSSLTGNAAKYTSDPECQQADTVVKFVLWFDKRLQIGTVRKTVFDDIINSKPIAGTPITQYVPEFRLKNGLLEQTQTLVDPGIIQNTQLSIPQQIRIVVGWLSKNWRSKYDEQTRMTNRIPHTLDELHLRLVKMSNVEKLVDCSQNSDLKSFNFNDPTKIGNVNAISMNDFPDLKKYNGNNVDYRGRYRGRNRGGFGTRGRGRNYSPNRFATGQYRGNYGRGRSNRYNRGNYNNRGNRRNGPVTHLRGVPRYVPVQCYKCFLGGHTSRLCDIMKSTYPGTVSDYDRRYKRENNTNTVNSAQLVRSGPNTSVYLIPDNSINTPKGTKSNTTANNLLNNKTHA